MLPIGDDEGQAQGPRMVTMALIAIIGSQALRMKSLEIWLIYPCVVLALQGESYLTASADELRWRHDTVQVRLYVGEKFRWARLRNGNLGDGLLTRAGYREKVFRQTPFVPADWARLPYEVMERISTRITNEVADLNRVTIDITSKPPGTIEWE